MINRAKKPIKWRIFVNVVACIRLIHAFISDWLVFGRDDPLEILHALETLSMLCLRAQCSLVEPILGVSSLVKRFQQVVTAVELFGQNPFLVHVE